MKTSAFLKHIGRRGFVSIAVGAVAMAATAGLPAYAQEDYPNRPVTIVLPYGPGGVSDITARLLAEHLSESFGQRFIVENVPGAAGSVATQQVLQAGNDGYTLLNMGNSSTIRQTLRPNLEPNQIEDFEPVTPVAEFGLVIVTAPDSEIGSVEELVAMAKENPNSLNIGSVASGSTQNLSALLFESVADIDVTVVPYNSSPELMGAVARGDVDVGFEIIAGALSAIENGQVVPIATTMSERSEVFPDVPTVEESGVTPFDVSSWNSYVAPNGVPANVVETLNAEIQRIMDIPEVREKMLSFGIEPFEGGPEAVDEYIEMNIAKWRSVIEEAGMPIQQ